MRDFLDANLIKIIGTVVTIVFYPIVRYPLNKLVAKYSDIASISRTKMLITKRTLNVVLGITFVIVVVTIWGVHPQNILLTLSSIFAVIGVAFFAQWSVLSNVTSGFILFFSLRLKIGDTIKILDKDFPIVAEVEDIKSFYIYLRGEDCQRYIYPNNLLLQKGISIVKREKSILESCREREDDFM